MPHVRTIFISDVHIGSHRCQAGALLDFLTRYTADTIYLVGDIIDGWALTRAWYWEPAYNELVNLILAHIAAGFEIVYVTGNHDEFLRQHNIAIDGVTFVDRAVHVT